MTFNYIVSDSHGREQKGMIEAKDVADAKRQLVDQDLQVIKVEEAILGGSLQRKSGGRKPKVKELAVFCRQFCAISEAGIPIVQVLEMLGGQTENAMLQNAIFQCKEDIEMGEGFAEAMSSHPKVFSKMFVTLVEAGEISGSLEKSLIRMATQFEKEAYLQSMIKKAGVYPAVVLCVALVVVVIMLVFVVPQFEAMFADMGTTLPAITVFVVNLSAYLQENWMQVIAGGLAIIFCTIKFFKSPTGETFASVATLKIPVVNNLVSKTACARTCRTMSTLRGSGMGDLEALEITAETMSNLLFRTALLNVREEVSLGESMKDGLIAQNMFPPLMYHMVGIGEATGKIEEMMDTLAGYYEEEVEAATESLMALLEPLTIILLAVLVGGIIGSVMAPMATMYEELGNL